MAILLCERLDVLGGEGSGTLHQETKIFLCISILLVVRLDNIYINSLMRTYILIYCFDTQRYSFEWLQVALAQFVLDLHYSLLTSLSAPIVIFLEHVARMFEGA